MDNHYDQSYYDWQKKSGELGALIDLWKFSPYIRSADTVLDFGCGGGYILEQLKCKKRYGVDISPVARREAESRGIVMSERVQDLPADLRFDAVISHHSLEHVEDPAAVLKALRRRMRPNAVAVHVVPINDWRNDRRYDPSDINKHLYTWTPLLLGNLFVHCGYEIEHIEILTHAWLPLSRYTYRLLPHPPYHLLRPLFAFATRNRQIRIVARAV